MPSAASIGVAGRKSPSTVGMLSGASGLIDQSWLDRVAQDGSFRQLLGFHVHCERERTPIPVAQARVDHLEVAGRLLAGIDRVPPPVS